MKPLGPLCFEEANGLFAHEAEIGMYTLKRQPAAQSYYENELRGLCDGHGQTWYDDLERYLKGLQRLGDLTVSFQALERQFADYLERAHFSEGVDKEVVRKIHEFLQKHDLTTKRAHLLLTEYICPESGRLYALGMIFDNRPPPAPHATGIPEIEIISLGVWPVHLKVVTKMAKPKAKKAGK